MAQILPLTSIKISEDRQRKQFKPEAIAELAQSISTNELLHAIIIDSENNLIAGERRLRAIKLLFSMGAAFKYNGEVVPKGSVPCTTIASNKEAKIFEAELVENIQRINLTPQEEAEAIARLHTFHTAQNPRHTINDTAVEISRDNTTMDLASGSLRSKVKESLLISQYKSDPRVAQAKTHKQAVRAVEKITREEHAKKVAEEFSAKGTPTPKHNIVRMSMGSLLTSLPDEHVDAFVTDPPYGINAQEFGTQTTFTHKYDDTPESWEALIRIFAKETFRVAKSEAHAYVCCDFSQWQKLSSFMSAAGWKCWPRPLIWYKGHAGMLPHPDHGPRYSYETILFASKGDKQVQERGLPDVLYYPKKRLKYHAAEKPVGLFLDLIKRSVAPGGVVCDPFMGCGTIIPAANVALVTAIAGDIDETFFGIALQRLEETDIEEDTPEAEEIDLSNLFQKEA